MEKNSQLRYDSLKKIYDPQNWKVGKETWLTTRGQKIVDDINAMDTDLVIDAGCGRNVFKGKIKNLVGFDIVDFPNVDFVSSIQDAEFENESADVVLALGSVQFGNKTDVYEDVAKLVSWVKPGGMLIFRNRTDSNSIPDHAKNRQRFKDNIIYWWTKDDVNFLSEKHNLSIISGPNIKERPGGRGNEYTTPMLFWRWRKNV
jgi:hypothetical protein